MLPKILHLITFCKLITKFFEGYIKFYLLDFRADHDDQEVVMFNRIMLPAYYGLLRLCCQQSHTFTRHLASHQNLQWAFKNITPHPTQYSVVSSKFIRIIPRNFYKSPT